MTAMWRGVVRDVVTGGYLIAVPRLDQARLFGSTTVPVPYPSTLTAGQAVIVGFLENDPDQLVIIRPA